ncbi:exopolysaccharide biosynthesis polyprenyl glycosylphosphotransferase [Moheibacter stercoris]
MVILDLTILVFLFFLFLFVNDPTWDRSLQGLIIFGKVHYKSLLLFIIFWLLISNHSKLYKSFRLTRYLEFARKSTFQTLGFAIILFAISGGKSEMLYSSKLSLVFLAILFIYLLVSRFAVLRLLKHKWRKGLDNKNVLLVGYNNNTDGLLNLMNEKKEFGLMVTKILVSKDPKQNQQLFDLETFQDELIQQKIDIIYICLGSGLSETTINQIVEIAEKNYKIIGYIPDSSIENKQSLEINYLDSFPILYYKKLPLDHTFNQFTKRVFDIVFTVFVFVFLLSWLMPIIALLVLITQGRPIFFSQKRNGLNGEEFDCLKFRTMIPHKHNSVKPTERNDPRVTRLGRILRKTSLDELPQFINVLKGEMSIVGPRPHMVSENESYSEIIKRYSLRHYVKPGITGLAQTKGYRGAIDSDIDMEKRIRADIYYVRNWSFLLDIFIIYKTVKLMIFGDENAI